jgi:outer membrane protein TolC
VELREKDLRPDFEVATSWNSMWNTEEHRWTVGASINLPVRTRRVRAGIAQSEARVRSAESARLRLEDDVRSEVQQAWTRAVESRHVVELHRSRLLPAANDQVQAALSGFRTGRNSFLAVIEAERNQRTTELAYQRSLSELHQRLAGLDRALGRMPGGQGDVPKRTAATGGRP